MYLQTIALLAAGAMAATIQIDVGKAGLIFSPNSTTAAVGDVLAFNFYSNAHTVVQGDFSTPCQQGSLGTSGFGSGPVSGAGYVFSVLVNSLDPIWFYCSVSSHCSAGMVGVVNPPSSGNTLDSYKSAAKSVSSVQGVSSPQGGTLATAGSGSSGAATTGTAASASAPASVSASQTKASSTASATAAATTTSGGMALMETSEKIALTSVLVGLGLLVMLMI